MLNFVLISVTILFKWWINIDITEEKYAFDYRNEDKEGWF